MHQNRGKTHTHTDTDTSQCFSMIPLMMKLSEYYEPACIMNDGSPVISRKTWSMYAR
jgi:hypothetical protein